MGSFRRGARRWCDVRRGHGGGDGDRVREAAAVSEAIKVQVRASPRLQRSKMSTSWLRLRRGLPGRT
jgi:hypothetical protein